MRNGTEGLGVSEPTDAEGVVHSLFSTNIGHSRRVSELFISVFCLIFDYFKFCTTQNDVECGTDASSSGQIGELLLHFPAMQQEASVVHRPTHRTVCEPGGRATGQLIIARTTKKKEERKCTSNVKGGT